jgi:hypothetical protein
MPIPPVGGVAGSTPVTADVCSNVLAAPLERQLCQDYGLSGRENRDVADVLSGRSSSANDVLQRYRVGSEAYPYAQLALAAYPPDDAYPKVITQTIPTGWILVDRIRLPSGFEAAAFQSANRRLVVVAFAGTDSVLDWASNVGGAVTIDPQVGDAIKYFNTSRDRFGGGEQAPSLVIVGHSLGGRLAQLVAARSGTRAFTFNPMVPNALISWALDATHAAGVTNLRVADDVVSDFANVPGLADIGTTVTFDFFVGGVVTGALSAHSQGQFVNFLHGVDRVFREKLLPIAARSMAVGGGDLSDRLVPSSTPAATIGSGASAAVPLPSTTVAAALSANLVADRLGQAHGAARYAAFTELLSRGTIPAKVSIREAIRMEQGMEDYALAFLRVIAPRLAGFAGPTDVNALAADLEGLHRFEALVLLHDAGHLKSPVTPADINALCRKMEGYRALTIAGLAPDISGNLGPSDLIALFGNMSSPMKLASVHSLKLAGKIRRLSSEEADAVAATFGFLLESSAKELLTQ